MLTAGILAISLSAVAAYRTELVRSEDYLNGVQRDPALVYLPDSYDGSKPYPVVYFLHGLGQEENATTSVVLFGKPGLRFEQSLDDEFQWAYGAISGLKFTQEIDRRNFIMVAPLAFRISPSDVTQGCVGGKCRGWNSETVQQISIDAAGNTVFTDRKCGDKPVCANNEEAMAPLEGCERAVAFLTGSAVGPLVRRLTCTDDLGVLDPSFTGFSLGTLCPVTCNTCPEEEDEEEDVCPDDEGYLVGLVKQIAETYKTDKKRTHISGFSSGAFMSYQMICNHAELFASGFLVAAPVDYTYDTCRPSEPVSIINVHGTEDETVQYDVAEPTFTEIASKNGCDAASALSSPPSTTLDLWTATPLATAEALTAFVQQVPDLIPFLPFILSLRDENRLPTLPGPETEVYEARNCPKGITTSLWKIKGANHIPRITDDFPVLAFDFFEANKKTSALKKYLKKIVLGFSFSCSAALVFFAHRYRRSQKAKSEKTLTRVELSTQPEPEFTLNPGAAVV